VLRLLYVDAAQTADTLSTWVNVEGTAKHKVALTTLKRLNLLVASAPSGSFRLHPAFQVRRMRETQRETQWATKHETQRGTRPSGRPSMRHSERRDTVGDQA
jgi:hypothetical protein